MAQGQCLGGNELSEAGDGDSTLLALGNEQEFRVVFGKEHVVKRRKALTLGAYLDMLERRDPFECLVVDCFDCFRKRE